MSNFRHRLSKLSPEKQRYALETLPSHLVGRAQPQRLHQLLSDFDFIESKIAALGVPALIEDYELAITADILPSSPCLQTWQSIAGALRLSAHILERDPAQLAGQLLGRLLSFDTPDLQTLLETAKQWRGKTWLRPLTANLTPPGGPLLRTLSGHNGWVSAVALSPDGQFALSGSND
ncbi:hypothetical protein LKK83_21110, partial [Phormidium sp. CCY1219]|nr:hypothetical protein [Phormidium sp. CCY1219]